MDQVISRIVKTIDEVAQKAKDWPDVLEVTGGFAKSRYLFQKLQRRYQGKGVIVVRPNDGDTGQCFPVAVGSLLRYDNIGPQPLPSVAFAMLQRQEFHEDVHTDSYTIPNYDTPEFISKKPWVEESPYDATIDVVDNRLVHILEKGKRLGPGEVHEPEFSLEFRIPVQDPHISADFVYLTKKFEDNAAAKKLIVDDLEEKYVFRVGVHPWASVDLPIPRHQLEGKGFEIITADAEKFWLLDVKVVVRCRGEDVQIGFKVLKPVDRGSRERKSHDDDESDSEEEYDDSTREAAFEVWEKFWEASHSEFFE
ncbi:Hypothetical predicted protein [Lecanosticta acicola]|uniref:Uncharacterized protein n=1 Tax=Lecanosticta acicola TaxID=111012 RepID=A0AAI9EBD1_9PEZI|nr:Hypothetical predicted protein [Lecanosticta acicola]